MAKKLKKQYSGVIITIAQAKQYLNESIAYWDAQGTDQSIKLARFAEIWRAGGNPEKKKMKTYYTSINQIKNEIIRSKSLGEPVDADEAKLKRYQQSLSTLESKYGKYIPPKSKKKDKDTIV